MYHKQYWYDREFRLEWAKDVHWPRDFEKRVHRVVDSVRLDFAMRALNQMGSKRRRTSYFNQILSHTKLNDEGLEGQLRHWYLTPTMG
jgi:hypothetical protein